MNPNRRIILVVPGVEWKDTLTGLVILRRDNKNWQVADPVKCRELRCGSFMQCLKFLYTKPMVPFFTEWKSKMMEHSKEHLIDILIEVSKMNMELRDRLEGRRN